MAIVTTASPTTIQTALEAFILEYVEENRSVRIQDAFDLAYGACAEFAEAAAEHLRETFPRIRIKERNIYHAVRQEALPRPKKFQYAYHVYLEIETDRGKLAYDALRPGGEVMASYLPFIAEQVRFARAY